MLLVITFVPTFVLCFCNHALAGRPLARFFKKWAETQIMKRNSISELFVAPDGKLKIKKFSEVFVVTGLSDKEFVPENKSGKIKK